MIVAVFTETAFWKNLSAIPVNSRYLRLNQAGVFMKLNNEFQVKAEFDFSGYEWKGKGIPLPINRKELVKKISA